jgi:hypothetical protein
MTYFLAALLIDFAVNIFDNERYGTYKELLDRTWEI